MRISLHELECLQRLLKPGDHFLVKVFNDAIEFFPAGDSFKALQRMRGVDPDTGEQRVTPRPALTNYHQLS